jgi:hypothetical protein
VSTFQQSAARFQHDFTRVPLQCKTEGRLEASCTGDVDSNRGTLSTDTVTATATGSLENIATLPKLLKRDVEPAVTEGYGGFRWTIGWELDKATTRGGWVVQKIEGEYFVCTCDGNSFTSAKKGLISPKYWPFWEAWQIPKGSRVPTALTRCSGNDTYSSDAPDVLTQGRIAIKGTPEFYDGLKLPPSFSIQLDKPSRCAPATTTDPGKLPGGTGTIGHDLEIEWNNCIGAPTKKMTVR